MLRSMSLLSSSTLDRQSPVWFGPLKVSPNATCTLLFSPFPHDAESVP